MCLLITDGARLKLLGISQHKSKNSLRNTPIAALVEKDLLGLRGPALLTRMDIYKE
jgi:hypothetical protein